MSELRKWKILESNYLVKNKWIRLRQDLIELPDGSRISDYFVLERNDWAIVFALTKENKVILVKEYKHAIGEILLGLPAGGVNEGESPREAIERELMEETGYSPEFIEELGAFYENASGENCFGHFFIAMNCSKKGEKKIDVSESNEVLLVSLEEVNKLVSEKKIWGIPHACGIFLALEYIKKMRERN